MRALNQWRALSNIPELLPCAHVAGVALVNPGAGQELSSGRGRTPARHPARRRRGILAADDDERERRHKGTQAGGTDKQFQPRRGAPSARSQSRCLVSEAHCLSDPARTNGQPWDRARPPSQTPADRRLREPRQTLAPSWASSRLQPSASRARRYKRFAFHRRPPRHLTFSDLRLATSRSITLALAPPIAPAFRRLPPG